MANITFSSPRMGRDVTVYAVAGDRGTVLSIAKAHRIPIPFDCQDGECGSCLVEVQNLDPHGRHAVALTDKEKELLRQLGKISRQEIEDAEVRDLPPHSRLACQYIVRHEDVVVTFKGDETVPEKGPTPSTAAKRFTGGIRMQSVEEFLAYAVKIEEDAALHFEGLSQAMAQAGNEEVAKLFAQLAGYSRKHLASAQERAGKQAVTVQVPSDYIWPDHVHPERTSLAGGDAQLTRLGAMRAALQGEKRGHEFYIAAGATSTVPAVAALAREFALEEAEHVRVLEGWLAREEWLAKAHEL
jgi:rubrerythrin/ferredoxin